MTVPLKLSLFALFLAAVFVGALALGAAVGPVGTALTWHAGGGW